MKLLVEAAWALVIFGAFLAVLYTLNNIGASHTLQACLSVGFVLLIGATCYTHWRP